MQYRLVAFAAGVVLSVFSAEARAECTWGDVTALAEQLPVEAMMDQRNLDRPRLADSGVDCQYRLFWDGSTVSFPTGEPFLGGVVWWDPYELFGMTRDEAVADIEATVDYAWIATVHPHHKRGPWVDEPLHCTAYKDLDTPDYGKIVYRQCSFIEALPAGHYRTLWKDTYYGAPDYEAEVDVIVQ